jgi:hypothetical protein
MTRRHFIRAAQIVRSYVDSADSDIPRHARHVGEAYISLFSEFNPRFDTQRFLVACGLAQAPIKVSKRKGKV